MRANGHSKHSINATLALLSAALRDAADAGWISVNPAHGVRRVRTKATAPQDANAAAEALHVPTGDEVAAVLAHTPRRGDRLMILTLAWTGMRFSQAAALPRVGALPPRSSYVISTGVWARKNGAWRYEPTKTGGHHRIPVPAALAGILREHADNAPEALSCCRDVLFPARFQRHRADSLGIWTSGTWGKHVWRPAREAAGQDTLTKHLRHYAASVLHAAGATEVEAAAHLGHRSVTTTQRHYLRALQDVEEDPEMFSIRMSTMTTPQRLDALWDLWVERYGDPLSDC